MLGTKGSWRFNYYNMSAGMELPAISLTPFLLHLALGAHQIFILRTNEKEAVRSLVRQIHLSLRARQPRSNSALYLPRSSLLVRFSTAASALGPIFTATRQGRLLVKLSELSPSSLPDCWLTLRLLSSFSSSSSSALSSLLASLKSSRLTRSCHFSL